MIEILLIIAVYVIMSIGITEALYRYYDNVKKSDMPKGIAIVIWPLLLFAFIIVGVYMSIADAWVWVFKKVFER